MSRDNQISIGIGLIAGSLSWFIAHIADIRWAIQISAALSIYLLLREILPIKRGV